MTISIVHNYDSGAFYATSQSVSISAVTPGNVLVVIAYSQSFTGNTWSVSSNMGVPAILDYDSGYSRRYYRFLDPTGITTVNMTSANTGMLELFVFEVAGIINGPPDYGQELADSPHTYTYSHTYPIAIPPGNHLVLGQLDMSYGAPPTTWTPNAWSYSQGTYYDYGPVWGTSTGGDTTQTVGFGTNGVDVGWSGSGTFEIVTYLEGSGGGASLQTVGAPPTGTPNTGAYTYWRVNITATRSPDTYLASVAEMSLTTSLGGTNLCTGGTPICSTSEPADPDPASNAFDGNPTTTWWISDDSSTNRSARLPQWIGYQLPSAAAVTHVYLTAASGGSRDRAARAPMHFNVEASNDGVHWTVIMNVINQPTWTDAEQRVFPLLVNGSVNYANRVYITSGTTWTVPMDWDSAHNTIECVGGGGASCVISGGNSGGGASGGGGAYSKVYNAQLNPGSTISINVGAGATTVGASGGDTWVHNNDPTAIVVAKGGLGGDNITSGVGGKTAFGQGYVRYAGGPGGDGTGTGNPSTAGATGGGGAAGPLGNGGWGGNATPTANWPGAGGGGNGGGTNGAAPTGSGAGGVGGSPAGGAGGLGAGSNGGTGTEWDSTHGSGGGGGGSGKVTGGLAPGNGGLYGGGGGGPSMTSSTVGAGANGIIVISYGLASSSIYYMQA